MTYRDKRYLLGLLCSVLYWCVIVASDCRWVDGPLAFVRGYMNYGIDWNAFMAPIGLVIVLLLPLCVVYLVLRGLQIAGRAIKRLRP